MTTIEITLPDQLAQEAEQAGLLSPELLADLIRAQLRSKKVDRLFAAMDRMSQSGSQPRLSPEEIAQEIAIMRRERRANKGD